VGIVANAIGAVTVALFLTFLAPPSIDSGQFREGFIRSLVAFLIYLPASLWAGNRWGRARSERSIEWLREGRAASERDRVAILHRPLEAAQIAATFWTIAAAMFALIWASVAWEPALVVGLTIALGGVSASAVQYLLAERTMRPITARALAGGPPPGPVAPGVAARLTMAWTLATGVPLLGVIAFSIAELAGADLGKDQLVATTLFLAVAASVIGLMTIVIAARTVAEPVGAVRRALERIEEGDFDARVEVDDGSEVGQLQAGFNRMAADLEERERLRDLFGRHVGREVAEAALRREVPLGGEIREVAALFVDLVGSTTIAARRPPAEVVGLLNEFFRIVVEASERHGGWVNKFEGDAALCVFGAPGDLGDPAGAALGAAREIRDRVLEEVPRLDLGIGVSAGRAVAGNVGAEERYEYTVIGDPVNEAARLCELAKERPERLLASEAALERASSAEAARWSLGGAVTLRGRDEPTRLATSS
jgi:adenylate cyclase